MKMQRDLFTVADQCIVQLVLEWAQPGLVIPPVKEAAEENRLSDLL
jgi:hypothetical protein